MKRYVEVFWAPSNSSGTVDPLFHPSNSITHQEPTPLLTEISKNKQTIPKYFLCQAFKQSCRNAFVISSPFDFVISLDKDGALRTDRHDQYFFDNAINDRRKQSVGNSVLLSTVPQYFFYSKDPVVMEMSDMFLLNSATSKNVRVVPGRFDISKWIRPIEFAFEIVDEKLPVEFKVGEPLFMVRFFTENDIPVKLTRVLYTDELREFSWPFVSLKQYRPLVPLKQLYKMAENYIDAWWRSKK